MSLKKSPLEGKRFKGGSRSTIDLSEDSEVIDEGEEKRELELALPLSFGRFFGVENIVKTFFFFPSLK